MSLIVQKFGGTSVGSLDRFKAVAERVVKTHKSGHQVVVVVSAMSGETSRLTSLGAGLSANPSETEMDVLLASGEQVSIALLTIAVKELGVDARSFLGFQIPIITDNSHQKARIERIDCEALKACLNENMVPVIAGFQGITPSGRVSTIGRGGSDTSAVAIAAALGADECQIFTDVPGIYTADPRVVKNARKLDVVGMEEMLEMASLGAKVLHSRAVEFAHKYRVHLRVLSSFIDGAGSLIAYEEEQMEKPEVSSVTYERDEAKLTIVGVPDKPGVALKIFGPVGEANINIDMIVQNVGIDGTTDISFTVKRSDFAEAMNILQLVASEIGSTSQLGSSRESKPLNVVGDDQIAKVTVVGIGMRSHAGVATRMFETFSRNEINIQMISTSEIKVSVVIDETSVDQAVNALHDAFQLENDVGIGTYNGEQG